jgi:hypothetical protein
VNSKSRTRRRNRNGNQNDGTASRGHERERLNQCPPVLLDPLLKETLEAEALRKIHAYWRACNYLGLGMIYLQENPLLQEPLKPET